MNANECWVWTGHTVTGYGRFKLTGSRKTIGTHVWSYRRYVGEIPSGLQLDHICRNRACANPFHLEPVTGQINTNRGIGPSAINATKTHCIHGHPFGGENLSINSRGDRVCRVCARLAHEKWKTKTATANSTNLL